jgi:hypothetical protein
MDYASRRETPVDRYFDAWRDHDVHALKKIFSDEAEYKINGRVAYTGLSNVETYWRRNKSRQTRVQILYDRIFSAGELEKVHFLSSFYDLSEHEWQSVAGIIDFTLNGGGTRILSLSEEYLKTVRNARNTFTMVEFFQGLQVRRLMSRISWFTQRLMSQFKHYAPSILLYLTWILFIFAVMLMWLLFVETPNWLKKVVIALLEPTQISVLPEIEGSALQRAQTLVGVCVTLLATAVGAFIPVIQSWRRARQGSLSMKDLMPGDDLRMMAQVCSGAERIIVFSGDFSFLRENERLRNTYTKLNSENKLTLVSSRTEPEVSQQLEAMDATATLLRALKASGNILFSSGIPLKCSLVELHRRFQFLYKYKTFDGNDKMCILRGADESHYLLEALNILITRVVSRLKMESD